jgi:hypothetical protein
MFNKPILFLIFNRIEHSSKVFESIRAIQPSRLYIAADGPRLSILGEKEKCNQVRDLILHQIDWDCEVYTLFRETNLGCGLAVSSAISWFFDHVDDGIILEDDCLPDETFFYFCSELLDTHRNNSSISIISGCNFDLNQAGATEKNTYFFSKIPYTWGWATWKRTWLGYDYNIKKWSKINKHSFLKRIFTEIEFQNFWRKIFDDIFLKNDTIWDYQFFFHCFLRNQLAIVPSVNLVTNIGHDHTATHTFNPDSIQSKFPIIPIAFPLKHNSIIKQNQRYDNLLQESCFGRIPSISYRKKITRYIKKFLLKVK